MLVTLPFAMLLLDYWPLGRISNSEFRIANFKGLVLEKIPFMAMSGIVVMLTIKLQATAGAVSTLDRSPLGFRIENAAVSYGRYLGKTFWPVDLALPYVQLERWPWLTVAGAVAILICACAFALWRARKYPFVFTGWFWFLGTLLPVIGLVQAGPQSMADRFTYLPLLGVFIILVWSATEMAQRCHLSRATLTTVAILLLGACRARTVDQLKYWRNSETLFRHTLAVDKNNYIAYNNLGVYQADKGLTDEAIDNYRQALRINPSPEQAFNNLGNALMAQKKYAEAITNFEAALKLIPNQLEALNNYGNALARVGRTDDAIRQYQLALQRDPDFTDAHNDWGNALAMQGKFSEAAQHYREVLCRKPYDADVHLNLGNVFALQGKFAEAVIEFREAVRLKPNDVVKRLNLANALSHDGDTPEAINQLREVLRLAPDNVQARQQLQELQK